LWVGGMAEQCHSFASQARARFSSNPNVEAELVAPLRTAVRSKLRRSPSQSTMFAEVVKSKTHNVRRSLPPAERRCQSVMKVTTPSVSPMLELTGEGSPFEDQAAGSADLSPRAITDAALLKSQLLLDQLMSLDLSDEQSGVSGGSAYAAPTGMDEDTEDVGEADVSSTWAWPTQPADQATVEVPVQLMQMLGDMWEQIKDKREKDDIVARTRFIQAESQKGYDDLDQVSLASTRFSSTSNLSSPDCNVSVSSPGSSASSPGSCASPVGCRGGCRGLSSADKTQLIQDLKDVLRAGSQVPASTHSPLSACAQRAPLVSMSAATSPYPIRVGVPMPSLRCVSLATTPHLQTVAATTKLESSVPVRRLVWHPVAVPTTRHVLAPC